MPETPTKNKYSAKRTSLFEDSFDGLNDSVAEPKLGHLIDFRASSNSLKYVKDVFIS